MTITAEQRQARRGHIGSSDSPAILGVDPWRNIHDVYVEKVHDLDDIEGSEPIEIGNTFEAPLVEWAAEQIGMDYKRDISLVSAEHPVFAANLDGLAFRAPNPTQGIEAKTTSDPSQWGDEGTDQVPDRVIIQTHHQMLVAELEVVWVPVLLSQFDRLQRKLYKVERKPALIDLVLLHGTRFWEENVVKQSPPSAEPPSLDVLKRIRRDPGTCVSIDPTLVSDFEDAKAAKKEAELREKTAKAALLAALGDAESAEWGDPLRIYTYLEQSRSGVDSKALKLRHRDIYEELERISTYRVLRSKKFKSTKGRAV